MHPEKQAHLEALRRHVARLARRVAWLDRLSRADQVENWEKISETGKSIQAKLTDIETELVQVEAKSASDRLRLRVRLNGKLSALTSIAITMIANESL